MKNNGFLLGMLGMVYLFGMSVIACDDISDDAVENSYLNGTWVYEMHLEYPEEGGGWGVATVETELNLRDGNFVLSTTGSPPNYMGTFIIKGDDFSSTTDQIYIGGTLSFLVDNEIVPIAFGDQWLNKKQLLTAVENSFKSNGLPEELIPQTFDKIIDIFWVSNPIEGPYNTSGDVLTIRTCNVGTREFTRRK
jgi:hypothetical protein